MSHASSASNAVNMIASPISLTRRASCAVMTSKARSSKSSNSALSSRGSTRSANGVKPTRSTNPTTRRALSNESTPSRPAEAADRGFGVEAKQGVETGADSRERLSREHPRLEADFRGSMLLGQRPLDVRAEQRDCRLRDLGQGRAHHANEVERRPFAEERDTRVERGEHRLVARREDARAVGRAARRQARGERDLPQLLDRHADPRREVRRVDARAREEQARVHRVLHVLRLEDRDHVRDGQAHVEQLLRDGTPVFGVRRRGVEQPRGFQLFEHGDEATPLCETAVVRDQPSGVVTFLFTDVEGSTRLWAAHTAVMERALARHDELLRAAIDDAHGYVFSIAGDSFGAAFAAPEAAVAAACAAQIALHREQWMGLPDGLRVRMGLHLGTTQERAGNYFGPAVNLAARVMSAAWGGQILCTAAVAECVGARTSPLGVHHLRDVEGTITIHQVVADGVREDFPPPRTLDAAPTTLPAQRSTFVGRGPDVTTVRRLLFDHRLVTLTGPGGTGKTRLAIEIAGREQPHHPGGTFFADLASLEDGDHVAATVARACLVSLDASRSPIDQLTDALASRNALVVFDNCEHLLDAAAAVADRVLASCPDVVLLATSREPLDLPGEHLYIVPPLDTGRGSEAAELFVERAAAAGGDCTRRRRCHRRGPLRPARRAPAGDRTGGGPGAHVQSRRRPSSGSTTTSTCCPGPGGADPIATTPCARRSRGATSSSTRPNGNCSTGSRCSPVRSIWPPRHASRARTYRKSPTGCTTWCRSRWSISAPAATAAAGTGC